MTFEKGIPVALSFSEGEKQKVVTEPLPLFLAANILARRHGVGRVDIVENRFIGIKVRSILYTIVSLLLIRQNAAR